MPNCVNCSTPAVYEYLGSRTPVPYCEKHLPSAFRRPEYAHLVIPAKPAPKPVVEPTPVVEPVVEAPKTSKKTAKTEAPSEAPAEETPTETAPEEEPKQ